MRFLECRGILCRRVRCVAVMAGIAAAVLVARAIVKLILKTNKSETSHHAEGNGEIIIVIDIGSSSIRCSAFRLIGDGGSTKAVVQLPRTSAKIPFDGLIGGKAEVAEVVKCVERAVECCIALLRAHGVRSVSRIGFSSLSMNIFGVDEQGKVLTPAFTYATGAPSRDCSWDCSAADIMIHYKNTGTILNHPSYASVHLRDHYLNTESSEVYKWTTFTSYICGLWTGVGPDCPISFSEASWTGLLNIERLEWDLAATLRLGEKFNSSVLPQLCDFNEFHRVVSEETSNRWPELKGARLYLALGDGAAANIGSVAQAKCFPSDVDISACVTVGTSAAVRVVMPAAKAVGHSGTDDAVTRPGLWKYKVDQSRNLFGGSLTDGGSLVAWFGRCFGADALANSLDKIETLVCEEQREPSWCTMKSKAPPLVLPFWSGERSTGWHQQASGTVTGMSLETNETDILYSILEGIAIRLNSIVLELESSGAISRILTRNSCLVASGGALEDGSRGFAQMIADVTGHSILVSNNTGKRRERNTHASKTSFWSRVCKISSTISSMKSTVATTKAESTTVGVAVMLAEDALLDEASAMNHQFDSSTIRFGTSDMRLNHKVLYREIAVSEGAVHNNETLLMPRPHMVAFYNDRKKLHGELYLALLEGRQSS